MITRISADTLPTLLPIIPSPFFTLSLCVHADSSCPYLCLSDFVTCTFTTSTSTSASTLSRQAGRQSVIATKMDGERGWQLVEISDEIWLKCSLFFKHVEFLTIPKTDFKLYAASGCWCNQDTYHINLHFFPPLRLVRPNSPFKKVLQKFISVSISFAYLSECLSEPLQTCWL